MDKKKILIVCHGFYPENSPRANRASELVKEFALQGHSVVVLTPKRPEHIAFEKEHQVQIKDLGKPKWKVPNFGSSKPGYLLTRMGVRFMQLFMEYPAIELMFKVKKALRMESGYDMLISIAVPYPIHWGVAKVWEKQQSIAKTWVADCGDPYMGCETDSFQKFFYFKYIEKWFMRKADYISIPVESARSGYYDEFQGKIKIIPQGFKFDLIEGSDKPVRNDIPTFAYAGGFIPNIRDPRPFLDYLVTLDHNFKFIVYTNSPALVAPYNLKLKGKLEIHEYIPRKNLLEILSRMDFLVNFDNNTGVQLPSKLIDYALTGRPVLNVKAEIEPEAIGEFLNGNYSGEFKLEDIQKFNIENVVKQFLELL
jgi:hypothetical protein